MKANELVWQLNDKFGFNDWPKKHEVDSDTYANACQHIFNMLVQMQTITLAGDVGFIHVGIGPHNGLMFKNVELLLEKR